MSILLGLLWVLFQAGADGKLLAGCSLVGAGVLLITEAYSRRDRKIQQRLSYDDHDRQLRQEWEAHQGQREWVRDAVLVGLLALTVLCGLWVAGNRSGAGRNQVVMGGEPKDLSLHLGPELEKAMIDALKRTQGQGGVGAGGTANAGRGRGFSWETVMLAAIAAGLLGWTVKKRPSAAPVVGAAELALTAIKNAEKLSRLDRWMFWVAMVAFLGVALVFLVVGLVRMRAGNEGRADRDEGGKEKKLDSPLMIGFSALVLGWAVVMVAYHAAAEPPKPGEAKKEEVSVLSVKRLAPVPVFMRGNADPRTAKAYRELKDSFVASRREGDMLLLLGSADCIEIHKSAKDNAELATKRAANVKTQLLVDRAAKEGEIEIDSLPQYRRCGEMEELRAVFPFLVHAESGGRN
ncbi:hypothetical protein P8936_00995 [Edaphobacter paludis]|uniref:OmpA-like domain-containing protein n=1 Tax=Edaphobacter paludis TaxID=3035702 RepID=A0AAU7D942_9BACT